MLIGQKTAKLTDKGRAALPVKFRKIIGNEIIICRWYERSLAVFSPDAWKKVLDMAVGESLLTSPSRDTERFLLGGAYEIKLDSQGRFVLPQSLKTYAEIREELVFIGLRDRVEVWDIKLWKEREQQIINQAEQLIREVQETKIANIKGMRS